MYGGTRRFDVRRLAEVDSTNRYLLEEAKAGAADGLVVRADHQTAGRGRLGRRWEAPAGANLLVSVLLRPVLPVGELQLCTVAMALAARSTCARVGVDATLKWPNDVMVGERKVAGILAETVAGPPGPNAVHGRVVVVGLGLNVGWPAPETEGGAVPVPDDLRHATSLWRESGVRVDPSEVLDVLLAELGERLGELEGPDGRQRLHSAFREACGTLGREVTVSLPDETVRGTVLDITRDGHLLVDVGACIRTITAGDVVHLRGSS